MLVEGIAAAFEVPSPVVRRAVMLAGSAPYAARAAADGGADALAAIGLEVGRPVQPMLAGSAPDLAAALEITGLPCIVDGKLDGIRIQVHRIGDRVTVWSRSLDELTDAVPRAGRPRAVAAGGVARARRRGARWSTRAVGRGPSRRPRRRSMTRSESELVLTPYFFDVLHLDGRDLLDAPATERLEVLADLVPERHRVPSSIAGTAERGGRVPVAASSTTATRVSWSSRSTAPGRPAAAAPAG